MLIYIKLAQSLLEYKALHFNLVLNERLDIVNSVSSRAPSNLSVHQAVADPTVFYEQADIIINATIPRLAVETFGLTLAEASVYGIPSIAPNHGGPAEIIHNGHTGIPIDDVSVETMRSAVIEFMYNLNPSSMVSH